jgi:quercetin dioxygenase-like cupin family protein
MLRSIPMVLFAGVASLACAQNAGPVPILPSTVQWQSSAGADLAWFVGAPDKPGPYAIRVKFPAGTRLAPHTHPDERFTTVLEGTLHVGFGDVFDETKLVAIPPGGMYVAPAGVAHFGWAKDGPVTYQESGMGPTATSFLKR